MKVKVKRAYESPEAEDGIRILVDRLWPRGVKKEDLAIEEWMKDVAPSNELRKWYHRNPENWGNFREKYFTELESHPKIWRKLLLYTAKDQLTLVYSSKNTERNNATALKEFLETHL